MGNTQSAEAPRRPPTKLTKPRTNTSTSNLLAITSAGSRHASNLELPVAPLNKHSSTITIEEVAESDDSVLKDKAASRPQRRSLFRSKSALPELSEKGIGHVTEVEVLAASNPLDRYSSMSSLKGAMRGDSHGAVDARLSMRSSRSLSTYDKRSQQPGQQSLVAEGQPDNPNPDDESNISGISFEGFDDIGQDISLQYPDDWEKDTSQPVLFRRRSMLTPGVATRSSWKEDKHRKSLPAQAHSAVKFHLGGEDTIDPADNVSHNKSSQANLRDSYDQLSKPTESPKDEIATFRALHLGDPPSRTVTPCDLEHRQIGAYKFGSLRITNGAASPSPSRQETIHGDTKIFHDTGGKSSDQTAVTEPLRAGVQGAEIVQNEWTLKFGPPKKNRVRFEFHEVSDDPPRIVDNMVEIPGFSLGMAEFHPSSSPTKKIDPQSPTRAFEMAQVYIQEISSSPFSFEESVPPSPGLQPTSKHTAIEDNLFDDESGSCISSSPSPSIVPSLYSSRFALETQTSFDTLNIPRVERIGSQQSLPRVIRGPREQPVKLLEKADSGYSSKSSLRSLRPRKASMDGASSDKLSAPPVPEKEPPPKPPKTLTTRYSQVLNISSGSVRIASVEQSEEAPPTPVKDWSPRWSSVQSSSKSLSTRSDESQLPAQDELSVPPYRQAPPVPLKHSSTTSSGRTLPPPLPIKSIQQTQAAAQFRAQEVSVHKKEVPAKRQSLQGQVPNSTTRPGLKTSGSESSISSTTRRLQKQQPAAPQRVVVQGYTDIESANIPPVSREASDHLGERLKNFPELTHTYKSVHRTNSKETLATIFSMASAELRAEQTTTTWSRFSGQLPETPSNADIERSISKKSAPTAVEHAKGFSIVTNILRKNTEKRQSRRRSFEYSSRRRSSSTDSQDQQVYIQDIGTVSESLGASPYDAAAMSLPAIAINASLENNYLKIRNDKKNSQRRTIGMDSDFAAQFARDRSRDRGAEGRQYLQRRQSYEDRLDLNLVPVPANIPRSKFMVDRTPPLPSLPTDRVWDHYMPKKVKSSPPVSMKPQRKPVPAQPAPATSIVPTNDSHTARGGRRSAELQNQSRRSGRRVSVDERSWQSEDVVNPADFRQRSTTHLSIAAKSQLLLEQQHQPVLQLYDEGHGTEQATHPSASQTQQSHTIPTRPKHQKSLARKSYDHSQTRREDRSLARASFDNSTAAVTKSSKANPLTHSQSYSQMPPSQTFNVDRFNGGLGYGYEHGYGIGGSAGMRNGESGASRKGVEGSVLWGVDLSDVPIIVKSGREGVPV